MNNQVQEETLKDTGCSDYIELLTKPGLEGIYERNLSMPEFSQSFELPTISEIQEQTEPKSEKNKPEETLKQAQASSNTVIQVPPEKPRTKVSKSAISSKEPDIANISSITEKRPKVISNEAPRKIIKPSSLFSGKLEVLPGDTLEKIREDISKCSKCGLCQLRNKTVPGEGSPYAKLMFIGEAPGADEDSTGIPFVGKAGQHLDKILAAAGFSRDEIFICNILKCRPPNNRNPKIDEMMACTDFLKRQIQIIQPKMIACLGNTAIKYIIGPNTPGITRIHGQWMNSVFGIPTMPMYHPSYLVRDSSRAKGSPNWQMWQDIRELKKYYDKN